MEILTKKRMLIISDTIISYSATLLWLLCYDYIFYYLYSKGINCKPGIPLGLLLHGLRDIIISLSIIISLLKSKKIKIIILITYFVFFLFFPSSFAALPQFLPVPDDIPYREIFPDNHFQGLFRSDTAPAPSYAAVPFFLPNLLLWLAPL